MANDKYRTAYVTQFSGYDFSALLGFCDRIEFLTSVYDPKLDLRGILSDRLKGFDPLLDVIVPVGSVPANFLTGHIIAGLCPGKKIRVAIYQEQSYHFVTV